MDGNGACQDFDERMFAAVSSQRGRLFSSSTGGRILVRTRKLTTQWTETVRISRRQVRPRHASARLLLTSRCFDCQGTKERSWKRDFHASEFHKKEEEEIDIPPTQALDGHKDATTSEHSPSAIPGAQVGGRKLAIVYTCTICNTRSAKQFTEQAYRHGVVLVRCPGCQNLHLIADRLGFFEDEEWDVEKALANTKQQVKTVTGNDVLEITSFLGDKLDEALESVGAKEEKDENTTN